MRHQALISREDAGGQSIICSENVRLGSQEETREFQGIPGTPYSFLASLLLPACLPRPEKAADDLLQPN